MGLCPGGSLPRGLCHGDPPSGMVEERAVRILLECILVWQFFEENSMKMKEIYYDVYSLIENIIVQYNF